MQLSLHYANRQVTWHRLRPVIVVQLQLWLGFRGEVLLLPALNSVLQVAQAKLNLCNMESKVKRLHVQNPSTEAKPELRCHISVCMICALLCELRDSSQASKYAAM